MSTTQSGGGRNTKWIVALFVAALVGVTGWSLTSNLARERKKEAEVQSRLERLEIASGGGARVFQVEVMRTAEEKARGLMFRQFLPEDRGMLFDFGSEQSVSMWMRNTYIPLDMLFIRSDGRVHHIHERAQPLDETPIPSQGNVRFVLEINGGAAAKLGLRAGDTVRHALVGR